MATTSKSANAATRGASDKKKRGPGRPEGAQVTREDILDAAESVFADLGYAGTTLRKVADAAGVTQALISYYFGTKHSLFKEVFLRRGALISQQRLENLDVLLASDELTVSGIVRAFLMPTLSMRSTPQGRTFLRLQARLHTEPPEVSYELRTQAYGDSTRRYVDALRQALPHLGELEAYWRVTLMIGTYLYAFSDTHRMEEMAPQGLYDSEDTQGLIEQVSRFLEAGLQAV